MDVKTKNLVEQAINGDTEAFGDLYEIYALDMYRFALSICKNPQDAEDAVGETAMSVFKSIGTLKNKEKFKSYLFLSLSNCCKKKMKAQNYNEEISRKTEIDNSQRDFDFSLDLKNALNKLDNETREIVMLSVVAGFSSKEIGKIMNLKATTVRSKLKRGIDKMRKELEL